jgi:hypothetical protein
VLKGSGLRVGQRGFDSRQESGTCLFATASRPALYPTQSPAQCVERVRSPDAKRPRREADHSSQSSVEVKNAWSYTSPTAYVFMAWYLINPRDDFTITLPLPLGPMTIPENNCRPMRLPSLNSGNLQASCYGLWSPPHMEGNFCSSN